MIDDQARLESARLSLDGLSVGDALGSQFFVPGTSVADLMAGRLPGPPWQWTDDTEMACSVVAALRDRGRVDQDELAAAFADRCDPYRGYGPGAVVVLRRIRDGKPWQEAAGSRGSRWPAARAAATPPQRFLREIHGLVPEGTVRRQVEKAGGLLDRSLAEAAYELGNGSQVTAQDTVPFTLWVAATHLTDYPAAIKACVRSGGDVDTTAAIVGGIVAAYTGRGNRTASTAGIPHDWLAAREPLPAMG